ncbi:MAG: glycosyltransferase family 4 protein [Dehalococcoidia bacterium]|jgi:glycosyltransferase involved in cell wall biosynthesis|nr:glycosyltransferase family 4 protein [Chloroflexota bacterium]MCK4242387.1 glycosyltransferase family 4 protein [Dehalococcoidia bacterium]
MYCGGQGVYLYYLSRELQRLGHEVDVVVGPPYPDIAPGIEEHRVENLNFFENQFPKKTPFKVFTPLNLYELAVTRVGMFPEMFAFSMRAYEKVRQLLCQRRFDIIHDNQTLGYGILLMKAFKIPIVATVHHPLPIDRKTDLAYLERVQDRLWRIMFYPFLMQHVVTKRMDRVITVSASAAEETKNVFKVPTQKLRVIYNGIDTTIFRKLDGEVKQHGHLIMVGNSQDRKKGLVYLLEALRLLQRKNDVKLTIVDRGLPDNEYAPQLVNRYNLDGRVNFTGKVGLEELVEHYSRAEVAVVPSLYEGFGLPAAEAMACGLPVIATTAGALPEVVEDGKSGILVPPQDAHALAKAIEQLLNDEQLRRVMGEEGRKRVQTHFTWEQAAKKTLEVYQEVL